MTDLRDTAMTSKAWPFEEARKLVKRFAKAPPEKGYVLFETGYGPSGLPHIGTFGEVAHKPLTAVPDPFEEFDSFGNHNNAMLRRFLDTFGFEYEFASSTEYYKAGKLDDILLRSADRYDDIMAIMLKSLREERQQTYSIFLPISPTTGRVLYVPMKNVDAKNGTVTFEMLISRCMARITRPTRRFMTAFAARWGAARQSTLPMNCSSMKRGRKSQNRRAMACRLMNG